MPAREAQAISAAGRPDGLDTAPEPDAVVQRRCQRRRHAVIAAGDLVTLVGAEETEAGRAMIGGEGVDQMEAGHALRLQPHLLRQPDIDQPARPARDTRAIEHGGGGKRVLLGFGRALQSCQMGHEAAGGSGDLGKAAALAGDEEGGLQAGRLARLAVLDGQPEALGQGQHVGMVAVDEAAAEFDDGAGTQHVTGAQRPAAGAVAGLIKCHVAHAGRAQPVSDDKASQAAAEDGHSRIARGTGGQRGQHRSGREKRSTTERGPVKGWIGQFGKARRAGTAGHPRKARGTAQHGEKRRSGHAWHLPSRSCGRGYASAQRDDQSGMR